MVCPRLGKGGEVKSVEWLRLVFPCRLRLSRQTDPEQEQRRMITNQV